MSLTLLKENFRANLRGVIGCLQVPAITLFILLILFSIANRTDESEGEKISAKNKAENITLALRIYAEENQNTFPNSLNQLYPNYIATQQTLEYKINKKPKTFHYQEGLSALDSELTPIIFTDKFKDNHRIVGFVGGHVEYTQKNFEYLYNQTEQIENR